MSDYIVTVRITTEYIYAVPGVETGGQARAVARAWFDDKAKRKSNATHIAEMGRTSVARRVETK